MASYPTAFGQPRWRIGAVVPPANPTVEIEYPALLPAGATLHTVRLPVLPGDLQARNQAYVDSYEPTLAGFGSLKLDGAAIALTGAQYRMGYAADTALCARLSERFGMPVETASLALANALHHLRVERITLVSPYPNWLTELAVGYWKSAGIAVEHVEHFEDELVAYRLTPEQVADRLAQVRVHADGAVLLTGTGMPTLGAIAQSAGKLAAPVLSSNACSMWSLARRLGAPLPEPLRTAIPRLFADSPV